MKTICTMTKCFFEKNNLTIVQESTDHNTIDENKEGRQIKYIGMLTSSINFNYTILVDTM